MKGGSIKGKDMAKFFKEYVELMGRILGFGLVYDSTVVALEKRKLEVLKNEKDSTKQDIRWREAVSAGEEILWEIMKELGLKETNAYRFSFRIMLLNDLTKLGEAKNIERRKGGAKMFNKRMKKLEKHLVYILEQKVKFIDVLDVLASVEVLRRYEKKDMSYLNIYHNLLAGLGRMHGIITTDEEESHVLSFFMKQVEDAQAKHEKINKGRKMEE